VGSAAQLRLAKTGVVPVAKRPPARRTGEVRSQPGNQAMQSLLNGPSVEIVPDQQGGFQILIDGIPVAAIIRPGLKGDVKLRADWDPQSHNLRMRIAFTPGVTITYLPALTELSKQFPIFIQTAEVPSLQNSANVAVEGERGLSPVLPELGISKTLEIPDLELARPASIPRKVKEAPATLPIEEPEEQPEDDLSVESVALTVADLATDFVPGVSNVKDATIALTGINPVTGEEVGVGGRILSGIFAIPGLGNLAKYVGKGGRILGKALVWIGRRLGKPLSKAAKWTAERGRHLWSWVMERFGRSVKRVERLEGEAPSTLLSQPGGLQKTEGRQITSAKGKPGKPSHPLTEHGPQVDPEHLKERVRSGEVDQASKFTDRAQMETAIGKAMDSLGAEMTAWASKAPAGANKTFSFDPKLGNLGLGYYRTAAGKVETLAEVLDKVWVVLKADGKGGYVIQSAFPSHVLKP
jgi:putative toxin of predicted polymorphic toxin system/CDI toxin RNase A-like protein